MRTLNTLNGQAIQRARAAAFDRMAAMAAEAGRLQSILAATEDHEAVAERYRDLSRAIHELYEYAHGFQDGLAAAGAASGVSKDAAQIVAFAWGIIDRPMEGFKMATWYAHADFAVMAEAAREMAKRHGAA